MNNNLDVIQYTELLPFISQAEGVVDFIERSQLLATVIMNELADRINDRKAIFIIQVAPIIDKMKKEVDELVEEINSSEIVQNQPYVESNIMLRLLEIGNPKLYHDYKIFKATANN